MLQVLGRHATVELSPAEAGLEIPNENLVLGWILGPGSDLTSKVLLLEGPLECGGACPGSPRLHLIRPRRGGNWLLVGDERGTGSRYVSSWGDWCMGCRVIV